MNMNLSQQRAVAHLSGPMMVLAGPGSGKTSVIVNRTEYLIRVGRVNPSSILVVTFSRASAKEMRERFLLHTGQEKTKVTFGTFHGVYYGILKLAYKLGPENILSEKEKYEILEELVLQKGEELGTEGDFMEEISREIGIVKGNRIDVQHYYSAGCPDEVFRDIYRGYQGELRRRRKLDFDDMLLYCYELFSQRPDILKKWQERFSYILIDEFQDINHLQYDIVRMLAAPKQNLFIVGDDDQSIYHFRGARPEIMQQFMKDYPDARKVLLDVNYRCSGEILSSALRVIEHNRTRFPKKLSTPNERGVPVRRLEFQTQREQYLSVVQLLRARQEEGEDLSSTAVLFRTNQEAEGMVQALMEYQVPFTMREQLPNLFHHWICRDLLAYMRLAAGEVTRKNVLQIMNRPNRYISRDAVSEGRFRFDALKEFYKDKDWMEDRITTLETHLRILGNLPPFAAINFIRNGIGYEEYLIQYAQYRKMKPEDLQEILNRLQDSCRNVRSLEEWEAYIEHYTEQLLLQAKKQEQEPCGVVLSTLHRVKGLEYDRVFILNLNEGILPYRKAVLEDSLEEERRLFYVGMTRAKNQLTLCYARKQYEKTLEPSRFLEETEE